MLKETWLSDTNDPPISLSEYVSTFRCHLTNACEMAQRNLKDSQKRMKVWYDHKAKQQSFKPGNQVLMLLPISGHPLQARYYGPYVVEHKVNDVNYVVCTPDRHNSDSSVMLTCSRHTMANYQAMLCNRLHAIMVVASASSKKLKHLPGNKSVELKQLILEHSEIFPDVPSRTTIMNHNMDVGNAEPVKQHPYHVNPLKRAYLQQEVK